MTRISNTNQIRAGAAIFVAWLLMASASWAERNVEVPNDPTATEDNRRDQAVGNECIFKRGELKNCPLGQQKRGPREPRERFSKTEGGRLLESVEMIAAQAGIALASDEMKAVVGSVAVEAQLVPISLSVGDGEEKVRPKTKT